MVKYDHSRILVYKLNDTGAAAFMLDKSMMTDSQADAILQGSHVSFPANPLRDWDYSALQKSDVGIVTIPDDSNFRSIYLTWVNGTSLLLTSVTERNAPSPIPSSMSYFPYPRFTTMYSDVLLVYHQVDDNTIAELSWNHTSRVWVSSNITAIAN